MLPETFLQPGKGRLVVRDASALLHCTTFVCSVLSARLRDNLSGSARLTSS